MHRERAEPAVGDLVAGQQPTGHRGGVEHARIRPPVAVEGARRLEEAGVERGVVGDEDRIGEELEQLWQDLLHPRRGGDHGLGNAGQHGNERGDRTAGVDQGGELAELFPAADLDRADLGDAVSVRRAAGGLEVEDDERDRPQRRTGLSQARLRIPVGHVRTVDAPYDIDVVLPPRNIAPGHPRVPALHGHRAAPRRATPAGLFTVIFGQGRCEHLASVRWRKALPVIMATWAPGGRRVLAWRRSAMIFGVAMTLGCDT